MGWAVFTVRHGHLRKGGAQATVQLQLVALWPENAKAEVTSKHSGLHHTAY
jgi:hypothetical protein